MSFPFHKGFLGRFDHGLVEAVKITVLKFASLEFAVQSLC